MKKIAFLLAALALTLAGCAVPVSSANDTTDVTTDVSSSNDGIDTGTTVDVIVNNITDVMSEEGITIDEFCTYVTMYPEEAWSAFDEGASGYFTYGEYEQALNEICS